MLKSKKHVFWEALIITLAIFIIGLFLGMMIETINSNKINSFYLGSEISLVDGLALSQIDQEGIDCDLLKERNIAFANRIYEEAKQLEQYEESGKLTENMGLLHKKYDLLRTLSWIGNSETLSNCENYNLIIYLYEYENEDLAKRATQNVWSKILLELKDQDQDMVLLPIAVDQNITSLELLLASYEIPSYPALILNNREVITEIENVDSLRKVLDNI